MWGAGVLVKKILAWRPVLLFCWGPLFTEWPSRYSVVTDHTSLRDHLLANIIMGVPSESSQMMSGFRPFEQPKISLWDSCQHPLTSQPLTLPQPLSSSLSTLPTATSTARTGTLWAPLTSRPSADSWVTRASRWSWRNS